MTLTEKSRETLATNYKSFKNPTIVTSKNYLPPQNNLRGLV